MKKMFRCCIVLFLFGFVLYGISCSKTDRVILENQEFDLKSFLTVQENTELVSELFFKMGVTKVIVKSNMESYTFYSNTRKIFYLNGKIINMSEYVFNLDEEFLSIEGFNLPRVTLLDGKPFIDSYSYSGLLAEANEEVMDSELAVLLLFLNEITTPLKSKGNFIIENINPKGCSFWDTYYVFSTGVSSSVASDRLDSEIDEYGMEDCTAIGSTDVSCIWGDHGCVATQAYCCE